MVRVSLLAVGLAAVAEAAAPGQPRAGAAIPRVISAEVPKYPRDAAAAGVSGVVELILQTDGKRVTDVRMSRGDSGAASQLVEAAIRNARTWRFSPHVPMVFNTTFRYSIVDRPCDRLGRDTHNAAILNYPGVIDVFAERDPACPGANRPPPVFGIYIVSALIPAFPPAALEQGIDGDVTIGMTYKGVLSVAGGPEGLAEPVLDGIRETWAYNPAPYAEELKFKFRLEDGECLGGPYVVVGPGFTSYEIKDRRACKVR